MTVLLESVQKLIEEGFKITTFLTLFLLWRKHQSSKRMKKDIESIKQAVGVVECPAHSKYGSKELLSIIGQKKNLLPQSGEFVHVPIIGGFTPLMGLYHSKIKKGNIQMKKFTSRKFILAVAGAILIILNDGLELGIDSDTVLAFAGLLATWIVGESAVDAKRAGGSKNADFETPIEPRV